MRSHVLGMGSFLSFPSSSVVGHLNWNFLKGFHKHFCVLNYVACFTILTKSERVRDVGRIGSDFPTCGGLHCGLALYSALCDLYL